MWRPEYADYPAHREVVSWYRDGKPSSWSEPPRLWPKFQRTTQILLKECPPPAYVLDLGCFTGYFLRQLATCGYRGFGLDLQSELMAGLHGLCASGGPLDFGFGCVENVGERFPPGTFDAVVALDVWEHLLDDHRAGDAVDRVLRPGGTVVVHVPRADDSAEHLRSYASLESAQRVGDRWGLCTVDDCEDEHGRSTWLVSVRKPL